MSYYDAYGRLNDKEKEILKNNLSKSFAFEEAYSKAMSETQFRFGAINHDGDSGDAFRHCFWSALLARDVGYDLALEITNAHEDFPGNNPQSKAMDLYNNAVGLELGKGPYKSDVQLIEETKHALQTGKLKTLRFKYAKEHIISYSCGLHSKFYFMQ